MKTEKIAAALRKGGRKGHQRGAAGADAEPGALPGGSYSVEGEDQSTTNLVARQSCLGLSDMHIYLKSKPGYGLHISGLKVYDAPKGLDAFRRACVHSWYCDSCAMNWENNGTCGNESLRLKRPPQNWCYVQEVE